MNKNADTMRDMNPEDPHTTNQPPVADDLGYDPNKPEMTLGDLLNSGLVGMWADRTDITDSVEFARKLREQESSRGPIFE